MASDTVYDAVKAYLSAQWGSTTPIQWENGGEPGDPPFAKPEPPAPFIAVELTGTLYGQQSIGAGAPADNRWDEEGILWIHVMVPTGSGASTARRHAKRLADLFRGTRLLGDSLTFGDARIGLGEPGDDDGNWYRISTDIEWRRMEA
jgi:hypothetical protein